MRRDPTPFRELNGVLLELVTGAQALLGRSFVAACLQGSFAVGGFDQHSDVDWIIVVEDELSQGHVEALQAMHGHVYGLQSFWAQHLEGSYFPREVLRNRARCGEPLWYLDNGARSLVRSPHCNTVVVRWQVREHGVSLAGPDPRTLVEAIPVQALRRDILETIVNWGREILADPEPFCNRFYQSFLVLSYCRMLHDLVHGCTGSKQTGAAWAKATLDPCWSGLIDRTWAGRPVPEVSVRQPADPQDMLGTLEFVQQVIERSLAEAAALGIVTPAA